MVVDGVPVIVGLVLAVGVPLAALAGLLHQVLLSPDPVLLAGPPLVLVLVFRGLVPGPGLVLVAWPLGAGLHGQDSQLDRGRGFGG